MDALHQVWIDNHAAVDQGSARHIVSATADCRVEAVSASKVDSGNDVGHAVFPGIVHARHIG